MDIGDYQYKLIIEKSGEKKIVKTSIFFCLLRIMVANLSG
jgi:hypothetical protein